MRRAYLVVAGIEAVLLLAVGAWWLTRPAEPIQPPALVSKLDESANQPTVQPAVKRERSFLPPELFGKVQAVYTDGGPIQFELRSTKPNTAGWDSEQNAHYRRVEMTCWLIVREGDIIHRRGGEVGELAVGQTVSAWCDPGWLLTLPAQGFARFVVIEPDDW